MEQYGVSVKVIERQNTCNKSTDFFLFFFLCIVYFHLGLFACMPFKPVSFVNI